MAIRNFILAQKDCIDERVYMSPVRELHDKELFPCHGFFRATCGYLIPRNPCVPVDTSYVDEKTLESNRLQLDLQHALSESKPREQALAL